MTILNLIDTEYLDEFDYGDSAITNNYKINNIEEPVIVNNSNIFTNYKYHSILKLLFSE